MTSIRRLNIDYIQVPFDTRPSIDMEILHIEVATRDKNQMFKNHA